MVKRAILIWVMALCACLTTVAQVSADYYLEDGTRYVCSQQEVMYDNFFHAARFAVSARVSASGLVAYSLEVTYDEGLLKSSQGDSLTLVLRGGARIILKTDRDVTRADIVKRHYRTYNDYYVTCHYPMSTYDVQRISRNRVTKLSAQAGDFIFDRKLEKFQDRFRRLFSSLYKHLTGGKPL